MKQHFRLVHSTARQRAAEAVLNAPEGWVATVQEPNRSLDANAAMWPILQAFSEQLEWPVNGVMGRMSPENWKDVLTAAFRQEQVLIAQGLNGGMVMLGQRTSKFKTREFSEWLEFIHAVAAEKGVVVYAD
jgi:hypothetical protein